MKSRSFVSIACAALALVPFAALADAPATPAPALAAGAAPKAATNAQGKISSVDAAAKTITITSRRGANTSTITWDDSTKIYKTSGDVLTDIKVGDSIRAYGAATPEAPTLTATHILIVPTAPAAGRKTNTKTGFHRNSVDGVVASTTPTLTLTTAGGVTVTANVSAETKVEKETEGSASDLFAGITVQAKLKKNAPTPTATTITIVPARGPRAKAK